MAVGNRRAGWETVVYVDGYDLSLDSNNFEPGEQYDRAEVSGYQQRKQYIPGQGEGKISYRGWMNTTALANHAILQARNGSKTPIGVAATWGNAVGDPGVAGSAMIETLYHETAPIGGAVGVQAEFSPDDNLLDWIQTLLPKGALAAAGAAKDDGASSAAGLRAYLHQFAVLGGTPVITIEGSSTGTSGWSAVATFSAGTVAGTAQGAAAAGAVPQFLRANVSGGSATAWLGYKRL